MPYDIDSIKQLSGDHFQKLIHLQHIVDMHVLVFGVMPVEIYTDMEKLADRYIGNFFRCDFDAQYNFTGFKKSLATHSSN